MTYEQIRNLYLQKTRIEPTEEELNILTALELTEDDINAYLINKNKMMVEEPEAKKDIDKEIREEKQNPLKKLFTKKNLGETDHRLPLDGKINIFNIFK